MSNLPKQSFSPNVLLGYETSDDAGVFKINEELALVQTVDFFTPIVDEPKIYGRIAAINSLNDIYAMGGEPLTALSIACYPQKGDWKIFGEILLGGQNQLNEENVVVLGGHSIDDQEIKFGYAVTGTINPKKIVKNSEAKEGDILILTKPIGTGVISTAIKYNKASKKSKKEALKNMTTSAKRASKLMQEIGANACTDITGFGFLGHAYEMAKASKVTLKIESNKVPLMTEVIELIKQGMLTRGDKNNRDYTGENIVFNDNVSGEMQSALFDPQTAGGLLISFGPDEANAFIEQFEGATIVGKVEKLRENLLEVE